MVTPADLWEPPDAAYLEGLRANIAAHGVRIPILAAPDGEVVDGFTRQAIAVGLGIECPRVVGEDLTTPGRKLEAAIMANARHRTVRVEERDAAIAAMVAEGLSTRTVAEVLGVSKDTVSRSTVSRETVDRPPVRGRDERVRPARSATPEERERRRDVAQGLIEEGYAFADVYRAMGMSNGTLSGDLKARKVDLGRKRLGKTRTDPIPPERAVWRSEDAAPPPRPRTAPPPPPTPSPPPPSAPRHRTMGLTMLHPLELFVEAYADGDYANRWAFLSGEAIAQGDEAWVKANRALLVRAVDQIGRLSRILDDADYRRLCQDTEEGRENLRRPTLRAVNP